MQMLGAVLSWVVATVLLCSGALKLGGHREFYKSMLSLGLPSWTTRSYTFARTFPYVELGLGALVLVLPRGWVLLPLAAATLLFAAFLVVVVRAVRSAVPARCNCFGGLGADELGPRTIVRNALLVALALAALVAHSAPASVATERIGGAAYPLPAVLGAVVAGAMVLYRNRRRSGARHRAISTLTVHNRAGDVLPISELQDPPSYVVFFSPGCGACAQAIGEFRWWPHALPDGYDLVPVLCGTPEQFAAFPEFEPLLDHAWYDPQLAFYRAVGGEGTPAGILIDRDHPLGDGAVAGIAPLRELIWTPEFTQRYWEESQMSGDDRARQLARQALIDGGWDPEWLNHAEVVLTNDAGEQVVLPPAGGQGSDSLTP